MNENAVRQAIKTLITNNASTLVTGLTFQGQPREIHQITTSLFTPPTGYYFIAISCISNIETIRTGFKTTAVPPSQATYQMSIEVSDYAIATDSDEEPFEQMDTDFQILTDRLISLLREERWIVNTSKSTQYRLDNERRITKNNLSQIWEDAAQYHAMLYCRVTFNLIEECTDSDNLYPTQAI